MTDAPKKKNAAKKGPAKKSTTKKPAPSRAKKTVADPETLRAKLIAASLVHIGFDGWSIAALNQGAKDAGLAATDVMRAFPRGARQAFEWFNADCDAKMAAELITMDLDNMRVRDRIATAVRARLTLVDGHRDAVRRGATFLAQPQNAGLGFTCLYRTVDEIWRAIGDTSTDYNFYTKRALLAGVIASTTLYWLDDTSADNAASWAFLDRRIADVMQVQVSIGRLKTAAERLIEATHSASTKVRLRSWGANR